MTNTQIIDKENFGALVKYKEVLPSMIAKKVDLILLRNLVLKTRGYLNRQSLKHPNKWSKSFCYIDIEKFTTVK